MLSLQATAKGTARKVTTKYGDRLVLDAIGNDGKEYAIWRPATDTELGRVGNGERLTLGIETNGKVHLIDSLAGQVDAKTMMANSPKVEEPKPVDGAYNGRSAEIADYIQRLGKLYKFSYQTAKEALDGEDATNADRRAIATTFFIQAVKHFDL